MAEEKKYSVKGKYEGQDIDIIIFAYSDKQAKFKAGLDYGIYGKRLGEFIKSSSIRVLRKV